MIISTLVNRKVVLFSSFMILILSMLPSSALGNTIYEEYCFSGLMYLMGEERAEKFRVQSYEGFLNNSEVIHFYDTPLQTLSLSNQEGKKDIRVYIYRDIIESSENVDMLFYYTDAYSEDYEFFGCAITSNNLPYKGIAYDTVNAIVPISWDDSSLGNLFSDSLCHELKMKTERVVINDLTFNLFEMYVDRSSPDLSVRWHGNLTLLVPYVEELPGKRSWDDYVEFRNSDILTSKDREILKSIKENKTTYIEMPKLEPIEPKQEGITYVLISQTLVAILIMVMVFYLIIKRKQELEKWKNKDEYR